MYPPVGMSLFSFCKSIQFFSRYGIYISFDFVNKSSLAFCCGLWFNSLDTFWHVLPFVSPRTKCKGILAKTSWLKVKFEEEEKWEQVSWHSPPSPPPPWTNKPTCLFTRLESLAWSMQGFWQLISCWNCSLWSLYCDWEIGYEFSACLSRRMGKYIAAWKDWLNNIFL